MISQNPSKEWERTTKTWLRSLWTDIDADYTGTMMSATDASTETSGQESSGIEGASASSGGLSGQTSGDEPMLSEASRTAAKAEAEKALLAELQKTDKQLAADIEIIEKNVSEDDEAKDLRENALAEAELAAKHKLQKEVDRLEMIADVARLRDARKQKQDAGLTDGSGYKSEFDIQTDPESQVEWAQGDRRTKLTARDNFQLATERPAASGRKVMLTKASLAGITWEEAQQAEWAEQQSFHGAL